MISPVTYHAVTQRICALNNHGVKSLYAGHTRRAEEQFGEAISLSKELIAASAKQVDEDGVLTYQGATESCRLKFHSCRMIPASSSAQKEEVNNPMYLYSRPLLLPQEPCNIQSVESSSLYYCAVILFNMGLMYHTIGLKERNSHALLARAESLYQCSTTLLVKGTNLVSQRNEIALLIITANGNNLAQIAHENGNIIVVRERLYFLDVLLRGPSTGTVHSVLTTVEWTGILSNVLLGTGLNAARAA